MRVSFTYLALDIKADPFAHLFLVFPSRNKETSESSSDSHLIQAVNYKQAPATFISLSTKDTLLPFTIIALKYSQQLQ
jgi:hypothetical protein